MPPRDEHPLRGAMSEDAEFERRVSAVVRRLVEREPTSLVSPRALPETAVRPAAADAVLESRSGIAQWSLAADGLWLPKSMIDGAGDLIVGTADNTAARLAIGPNYSTLGVNAGGALAYRALAFARIVKTSGGVANKYRAGWACVPLGAALYLAGGFSQVTTSFNEGLNVPVTGYYRVTGKARLTSVVSIALAVAKNLPSANVDASPYLITSHTWNVQDGFSHDIVALNAGDRVHLAIYTSGTEQYQNEEHWHGILIERVG